MKVLAVGAGPKVTDREIAALCGGLPGGEALATQLAGLSGFDAGCHVWSPGRIGDAGYHALTNAFALLH